MYDFIHEISRIAKSAEAEGRLGAPGTGGGRKDGKSLFDGRGVSFGDEGNVLELNRDDATTLQMY